MRFKTRDRILFALSALLLIASMAATTMDEVFVPSSQEELLDWLIERNREEHSVLSSARMELSTVRMEVITVPIEP